jgi:hypothetical protein
MITVGMADVIFRNFIPEQIPEQILNHSKRIHILRNTFQDSLNVNMFQNIVEHVLKCQLMEHVQTDVPNVPDPEYSKYPASMFRCQSINYL